MNVTPKISAGDVYLGMFESDVLDLLGQPSERREEVDENDDVHIHLEYSKEKLALTFWGDCDFRLGTITIEDPSTLLDGKKLIGLSHDEFRELHPEFDLDEDLEGPWQNYEDTDREVDVWIAEDKVVNFSIGPDWQDDETPIWPNP